MSLEDEESVGENLLFGDGDAMYMITTLFINYYFYFPHS